MRARRANGEFSAHFSSRDRALTEPPDDGFSVRGRRVRMFWMQLRNKATVSGLPRPNVQAIPLQNIPCISCITVSHSAAVLLVNGGHSLAKRPGRVFAVHQR